MKRRMIHGLIPVLFFVIFAGPADGTRPLARAEDAPVDNSTPGLVDRFLDNEMSGADEILFVVRKMGSDGHWYANFGYYADSDTHYPFYPNAGARLCILNLRTKKVRTILEEPQGSIRDPFVDYDGKKVLFSLLRNGEKHFNLYEMNIDGTGLRQLTSGPWDDIEPIRLPDGDIMFCSSRAKRWVQCWLVQVASIHRCDPDGGNIREISCNVEQDNTPWVLNDGKILYTRWEYVDRNEVSYHHLWTMNPDGTRQNVFFGNQKPGITMIDAKPIPGSSKVIASFSYGHGAKEHFGRLAILDGSYGPDDDAAVYEIPSADHETDGYTLKEGASQWQVQFEYADPWAFSEDAFMASHHNQLRVLNSRGEYEVIYELSDEEQARDFFLAEPRPIMKREREPVISDAIDLTQDSGTLLLTDIYAGRRMKDVPRGTVKELLVLETLPKPIHYSGWMEQISHQGTFTIERILGTVPVSPEGVSYFKLPAHRPVFFIAMDHEGRAVKRMHSFTSVEPGEATSCVGCHENRTDTPQYDFDETVFNTVQTGPHEIKPIEGIPEVFDFARDIQPIFDRHCVECHNVRETNGVNLTGHWGPIYTHSYLSLSLIPGIYGDNRNRMKSDFPPYEIGSCASGLYRLINEEHGGAKLSQREKDTIHYWLEVGANYTGTYAANACGQIGWYYTEVNQKDDINWPETKAMEESIHRRCDVCHSVEKKSPGFMPHRLSEDRPNSGMFEGYVARSLYFDLTKPEESLALLAPLAKESGGLGKCRPQGEVNQTTDAGQETAVFADTSDKDYQTILAGIVRGREYILNGSNRFCMEKFVPHPTYVREMKRYGILPKDHDPKTPIDPYETDRKYWESFWYRP